MSEPVQSPPPQGPALDPPALDPKIAYAFCRFAGGWWRGPTSSQAWLLTLGLGLCLAASTVVTVALNHWNRWFFDALEQKNVAALWQAVLWVGLIVAVMAAVGVGIVLTRETLQVRWRAWLIERLLGVWLFQNGFYHLQTSRTEPANPEYRIADDTRWATEPLTDLGIGLVIAVLNAAAFISILWSVGGSYTLTIGATPITIPAYMVIVALAYGITMSLIMLRIGRPLPTYVYDKNEREGDFRFQLMRLRENAESVALMDGAIHERRLLGRTYDGVVSAWLRIVRRHGHVTWITNTSGPLIPIVPLMCAAPKYLSGDLTLGQVTQLAGAFIAVQGAISWLVDNFNRISEWYASARRVMDIVDASGGHVPVIGMVQGHDRLKLERLTVCEPSGAVVLRDIDLELKRGETVYIQGETSIGKTTIARALSGLWTAGSGTIHMPAEGHGGQLVIVPQKPYLPLGSLREALTYGTALQGRRANLDVDFAADLVRVGLGALAGDLDTVARWDQRLSMGERQRLGIARALIAGTSVIVLDDALSALDDRSQADMLRALRARDKDTIIICLAQTPPPAGIDPRIVHLVRDGDAAILRDTTSAPLTPVTH